MKYVLGNPAPGGPHDGPTTSHRFYGRVRRVVVDGGHHGKRGALVDGGEFGEWHPATELDVVPITRLEGRCKPVVIAPYDLECHVWAFLEYEWDGLEEGPDALSFFEPTYK